jgi:nucleotide-binding universal stress UspA family protein
MAREKMPGGKTSGQQVSVLLECCRLSMAAAISPAASYQNTDLVMMPGATAGSFRRELFGSTIQRVLQGAHCPVLVFPPQEATEER